MNAKRKLLIQDVVSNALSDDDVEHVVEVVLCYSLFSLVDVVVIEVSGR